MATTQAEILGIKIQVDTSELPKLQAAAKDAGVAVNELGDSNRRAGVDVDEHSDKQTKLSQILGSSRAQTGLLINELESMAGVSGSAANAIGALASGIGGVGVAISVFAAAIGAMQQLWDAQYAKFKELNAELSKMQEGNRGAVAQLSDMASVSDKAAASALKYAEGNKAAAAELARLTMALENAKAAHLDTGDAEQMQLYADAVEALKAAVYKYGDALGAVTPEAAPFKDDLDYIQHAALTATDAVDSLAVALARNSQSLKDNAGAFVEETQAQGDAAAMGAHMLTVIKDQTAASAAQRTAASAAASQAKRDAELMADLQKEGAAIAMYAGEKGQQAFDMIANSALSAADKVQLLHRWESQLPEDIRQKIQIYIDTQGLANLMALFGVRGAPGGHQQGNEWNFTFEGEDPATRKAFLDKWGGDTEKAREDWYAQHQKDVEAKGVPKPDDWKNPYNPANSGNQDIMRGGVGIGGARGGSTIVINYTAEGFHTGREEELRANLLPVMERINRELNGR